MTIERKQLFATLAAGARITASRTMPFPHRYHIDVRNVAQGCEIAPSGVQALVDEKLIAGTPRDALWDVIVFTVTAPARLLTIAFQYFPRGFGYCAVCGELLEPPKGTPTLATGPRLAARHGFQRGPDRKEITPACEGSGRPLVDTVLPSGGAKHVAA